jgi:hypothetical protein
MKTLTLLLLAVPVLAMVDCERGCVMYEGACACDQAAEAAPWVKPGDDSPPSDKMPSYQREGIHADTPPSLSGQDAKQDQERDAADRAGKKAANVP